jgi:endonuclease/exonuclease/phosphatase (EEP) superfamily protein YafD
MTSTAAALLMERLGLSEDELCAALDVDPLTLIAGDLEHKSQLPILLALTEEAAARVAEGVLPRWVRSTGPRGRPLDHLLARGYAAFEDDLQALADRGFVLRGGRGGG